jgi:multidrug efflux system outer membrane protein
MNAGAPQSSSSDLPIRVSFELRASDFGFVNLIRFGKRFGAFLSAALLFTGCAVGPNYHPPKTEAPSAFANGNQTNLTPAEVSLAWWKGFGDPELEQLVQRASATNHDLRIAAARVREARALRSAAVADLFPVIDARAGYNKSVSSADSVPFPLTRSQRELELYNAGFDATWELDIFGRVRRGIEASTAEVGAAVAGQQDVLVSVVSEVARNYFELRGQQLLLDVARKNADNQRDTLELTVSRFNAGRATELDTARARAQLEQTRAAIPALEASVEHSIHRLGVLIGQPPTALAEELRSPKPIPALPPLVAIGSPTDLLRRRPDIRAAERSLATATAVIGVSVADLFPRVTFNGSLGFAATDIARLGKPGTDTYSFGPQITWAALDLGHVRARIQAAHARADAELANYEKTVLLALEETENALVDFGHAQVRRDLLRDSVAAASQATALARQRYDGGIADFLPVLDAQRTELVVEAELALSQTKAATSLLAIYKALAGGWAWEGLGSGHGESAGR